MGENQRKKFMELQKWTKCDVLKTHTAESDKEKVLNSQDNEIKNKLTLKNGNNHVPVF